MERKSSDDKTCRNISGRIWFNRNIMKGEIFVKHSLSFDIAKGKSVYCFIDELRNTIIGAR